MEFSVRSPRTRSALLKTMSGEKNFRFGAGYTDLLLDMKKQEPRDLTIINLGQLKDKVFLSVKKTENGISIGSLVTAANLVNNGLIEKQFPVLHEAAHSLASSQIRQVATVGGNLCTASPSGDITCALVSLRAVCEILSVNGELSAVPISEFFTGPRKTVLQSNEVLQSIFVPFNEAGKKIISEFIKIGTRRAMECSVVSMAYHFQTDPEGTISTAGLAIGAVAPTIRFAENACNFLKGKKISAMTNTEKEEFAGYVVQNSSPISDIRASEWYRKEVLYNISKGILENAT